MLHSRLFTAAAAIALIGVPIATLAQSSAAPATSAPAASAPAPSTPPATAPASSAPAASAPASPPPTAASPAGAASPNLVASGNLITTLQGSGHFTILLKGLDATNITNTLKTTPDLTLFAPTDEAFKALPPAQLAALMTPKNAPTLQKILTYHLVHLNLDSSKIKGAKGPVETVETGKLVVDGSGPVLKVNDAKIIQTDIHATNGYIQVVDKVLIPSDVTLPTAAAATTPATPPPAG